MRNVEILTQSTENIITLQELKDYLEITSTDKDTLLQKLVDASSDFVKDYTGYEWVETEYRETIDGPGSNSVVLSQRPVQDLTSVKIDSTELTSDKYVVYENEAIVTRKYENFPQDLQNVEVQYTAGYTSVPEDIKQLCSDLVQVKMNSKEYEGLDAYSIGDEDIKFSKSGIPSNITSKLEAKSKKRW